MGIVVCRVDDRLIHGQVVIGWGRPLEIQRILLVDAGVAASEFEQDLYRLAAPVGIELEFVAPDDAPDRLDAAARSSERTLVVTGSIATMAELHHDRPALIRSINLGGIHDGPGRREYLRYVYLSGSELTTLHQLADAGVTVSAQDLPTSRPIPLEGFES